MAPFGNFPTFWLEPAAIIPDLQLHLFGGEMEDCLHSGWMRMFYDIGQGFFADTQQMVLKDITDFPRGSSHREA
jgi:hypothetical protein